MVKVLELFSGTGSIGKVAKARGYEVVSLGLILPADIKPDINTWDYKSAYPVGEFDIITASPVCLWWSHLRCSNLGRKLKSLGGEVLTREILEREINTYGKPMDRKVLEIIEYFKPKYYWIENPQTGSMKEFLAKLPYYDVDYCKYADWGYKKRTRFWTNITDFTPKTCNKDCNSIVKIDNHIYHKRSGDGGYDKRKTYSHKKTVGHGPGSGGTSKHERYRIPPALIEDLFDACKL